MKKLLTLVTLLCFTLICFANTTDSSSNSPKTAKRSPTVKTANLRKLTQKHHKSRHHKTYNTHKASAAADMPVEQSLDEQEAPTELVAADNPYFSHSVNVTHRMLQTVYQTVQNLSHTSYKFGGTYFNILTGVYKLDCSAYVNQILKTSDPSAYHSLTAWAKVYKPISKDYYAFFENIPNGQIHDHWLHIPGISGLKAGDILVFRYKANAHRAGGHIMIIMEEPEADPDSNVYRVQVADSAPSGHSDDTRPAHSSGIGIGTLLLKVDPKTGIPYAYAWKNGARWEYNTEFAMARPA